jgi:adenylate kinase
MASSFAFKRNLSLVGPPGSGKGSYGRLFSKRWNIPLITVSDVLRQHAHEVMDSGSLVDDATVSNLLRNHLPPPPFVLDGFPRTLKQVHLMEQTWPRDLQIHAVVSLDVPKIVCEQKLLGRRSCGKCGGNYNVHAVHVEGFELPAQLPVDCCDHEHFLTRVDDVPHIVEERLETHYAATDPILDYFHKKGRLLRFAPFQGYKDVPRFQHAIETWITNMDGNEQEEQHAESIS